MFLMTGFRNPAFLTSRLSRRWALRASRLRVAQSVCTSAVYAGGLEFKSRPGPILHFLSFFRKSRRTNPSLERAVWVARKCNLDLNTRIDRAHILS